MKFYFFALAAYGQGISGGDRIFIEFARRWSKLYPIRIFLWEEGYKMCQRQNLESKNISFEIIDMKPWQNFGFTVNYFARIIKGIILGFSLKLENNKDTYIYSASEFWMDSLPCFILKLRYPNTTWMAAWFQTAPNPLKGFSEGDREQSYNLSALIYYLIQLPVKPLIANKADFVLVNNEEEKKQFPRLNDLKKVLVCLGAVNVEEIKRWQKKYAKLPKIYEGVFQGRFHPQKGVSELIDVWKKVKQKLPKAKLAMIGDGSLMNDVKDKIIKEGLKQNVELLGWVFDGPEKYRTFSQSKVVLHPAFYDSGGMASAEAMAFDLPAVGFNLPAYKSYYPKGMIKVSVGNLEQFANEIISLLENKAKYKKIANEAKTMIEKNWDWDKRAKQILELIS
jgi:glycosyltransferase involved in cell wall biosynthesis